MHLVKKNFTAFKLNKPEEKKVTKVVDDYEGSSAVHSDSYDKSPNTRTAS